MRYRGTPIFGDDGEEYVEYEPGEKRYVGEPSDEIDEAWNELTTREFSRILFPALSMSRSDVRGSI